MKYFLMLLGLLSFTYAQDSITFDGETYPIISSIESYNTKFVSFGSKTGHRNTYDFYSFAFKKKETRVCSTPGIEEWSKKSTEVFAKLRKIIETRGSKWNKDFIDMLYQRVVQKLNEMKPLQVCNNLIEYIPNGKSEVVRQYKRDLPEFIKLTKEEFNALASQVE